MGCLFWWYDYMDREHPGWRMRSIIEIVNNMTETGQTCLVHPVADATGGSG